MSFPRFIQPGNAYVNGDDELIFDKGRTLDSGEYYEPRQAKTESGAGHVQVADFGAETRYIECNFHGISVSKYNDLVGFLKDSTVRWSGKSFTFKDEDGTEYNVLYWGPTLRKSPMKNQDVDVDILLRVCN